MGISNKDAPSRGERGDSAVIEPLFPPTVANLLQPRPSAMWYSEIGNSNIGGS